MVNTPKRQSQGFAIQISILVKNIVKENLRELVKLHPQKVLTSKSVQTYIKKNLDVKPTRGTSKQTEDTASNNERGGDESTSLKKMNRVVVVITTMIDMKRIRGVRPRRTTWVPMKMYRIIFREVQPLFDKHLENFKIDVHSVNHDYLCIHFLHMELREIATQHRAQCTLAGLPILSPEALLVGAASHRSETPAFEFSSQADQEQAHGQDSDQQIEQIVEVDRGVVNIEETVGETGEHQAPNNEHLAQGDEHQAHDEHLDVQQNSLSGQQEQPGSGGNLTQLKDHSVDIEDTINNPGPNPISEEHNTDHQGPNPSNLQMVAYNPDSEENTHIFFLEDSDSSNTGSQHLIISNPPESPPTNFKLDEVYKVVASVDSRMIYIESKMTSLNSRMLSVDSRVVSMDSEVNSMDSRLKSMDSKLAELLKTQSYMKHNSGLYHRTFYDKVDTLAANVTTSQTALETSLIRQLAGKQYQLTH
ncbi:zinc finger CCCH domain-containing protein 8-like [Dorcoceras hygrometricum]|uniref:Zinc finger CCCH domain-containing protein 8-like n=1 Tax=Dorcoceras hygrometricum TaxID=472368 RepID=A0A2Z7DIE1_9LAMI|nr:zinc finger CCCH domain-containing protein 8-like [Dorcoceras hygrometricum]